MIMFINVRTSADGVRNNVLVDTATATPASILAQVGNDMDELMAPGCSVILNGMTLRPTEFSATLADLGINADTNISKIVKADSAAK